MSRRMKIIAVALALVAILTVVFTSIAFAADPDDNNGLPACCQQQQGQAVPGCCIQQGATANPGYGYQVGPGGCCGR